MAAAGEALDGRDAQSRAILASMASASQTEGAKSPLGLGCGLVFPVAFFGALMLLDYPRHSIWWTVIELFGWGAACLGTAYWSARFLVRFKQRDRTRFLFLLLAIGTPVALGWLLWLEIQPTTPTQVKLIAEYTLRAIGIAAIAAMLLFIGWVARGSRSRSRLSRGV